MSISLRHGKLDTSLATPRAPPGFMQVNNNERLAFIVFSKVSFKILFCSIDFNLEMYRN